MKQKFKWLLALVAMVASVNAWGDSYQIIFANNASSNTALTSTVNASTVIASDSRTYVTTQPFTVNSGNCYYGDTKTTIRVAKSNNTASLSIALSETGQKNVTSIVVNAYSSGNKNIGGSAEINGISEAAGKTFTDSNQDYTYNYQTPTAISSITIATTKAWYINSITVNYSSSEKTDVSLNANSYGKANGSVKYTKGNSTPDETPSWVTPKDNTGWILNGYYTAASGGIKIITASNTLVANTTYADANGKWQSEETTLTLYAQWGKTACAKPTNLSQTDVTATSATLTWDAVTGAASYTVYITGADSYDKTIDNITTNSVFLDDLSPNIEYMWSVQAIGDASKGYANGEANDNGDFTTEAACISPVTINKSDATLPEGCSFELSKTSGCGDDEGESVEVTCSPATHYTVTAVNSTSGTPGPISSNQCTISGITDDALISVTFTEDPTYTITFVDGVHGTDCSSWNMNSYAGTQIVFYSITDKTPAAPTGNCMADHYHFIGWVEDGTTPSQSPSNVISAGTTSINISKTVTYKAVWAKEEL